MYFSKETLATNSRLGGHWSELWANRNMWNLQNDSIIAANRAMMTADMLACNAVGGFSRDFWAEIDNQVLQLRDQEVGMEIVNDLIGVQTVLPVGKTAKLYNVVGDIADDVSVSIDGQAPFSFDHTDYASAGDP
ncbi:major capsid protein, partial [Enterobacter hormaechei]|uniref:major capsid protein n=1 Tax=Enterobacter hormaechei TaxID=158836 RepID=UPI001F28DAC1